MLNATFGGEVAQTGNPIAPSVPLERARGKFFCVHSQAARVAALCVMLWAAGAHAGPVALDEATSERPAEAAAADRDKSTFKDPGSPAARPEPRSAARTAKSDKRAEAATGAASGSPSSDADAAASSPDRQRNSAEAAPRHDELNPQRNPASDGTDLSAIASGADPEKKTEDPSRSEITWTGGGALQSAGPTSAGQPSHSDESAGWSDEHRAAARSLARTALKFIQEVIAQPVFWIVIVLVAAGSLVASLTQRKNK